MGAEREEKGFKPARPLGVGSAPGGPWGWWGAGWTAPFPLSVCLPRLPRPPPARLRRVSPTGGLSFSLEGVMGCPFLPLGGCRVFGEPKGSAQPCWPQGTLAPTGTWPVGRAWPEPSALPPSATSTSRTCHRRRCMMCCTTSSVTRSGTPTSSTRMTSSSWLLMLMWATMLVSGGQRPEGNQG